MRWLLTGAMAAGVLTIAGVVATGWIGPSRSAAPSPQASGELGEFKPEEPAAPAPEIAFQDADGNSLTLASFKGKLVLLNVWATWCAPCVQEMPSLDRLQQKRGSDRFAVVTISEDRKGEPAVADFFERNGITALPRYVDPHAEISRALNLEGLPTTLLIDGDGRLLGRYQGIADWSGAAAQALIDRYLDRPTAG